MRLANEPGKYVQAAEKAVLIAEEQFVENRPSLGDQGDGPKFMALCASHPGPQGLEKVAFWGHAPPLGAGQGGCQNH